MVTVVAMGLMITFPSFSVVLVAASVATLVVPKYVVEIITLVSETRMALVPMPVVAAPSHF